MNFDIPVQKSPNAMKVIILDCNDVVFFENKKWLITAIDPIIPNPAVTFVVI